MTSSLTLSRIFLDLQSFGASSLFTDAQRPRTSTRPILFIRGSPLWFDIIFFVYHLYPLTHG